MYVDFRHVSIESLMLNMDNSIEDMLIVVMSLLSFSDDVFTNACHCKVYLFGGLRKVKDRTMVDVQITKWKYRRNQMVRT